MKDDASTARTRRLNVLLWIVQLVLAAAFLIAGGFKLVLPISDLAVAAPAAPSRLVRLIGAAEVAGALGLLAPVVSRMHAIAAAAAIGLFTIMVLAASAHLARGEAHALPVNAALGAMALLVAWGRLRVARLARES